MQIAAPAAPPASKSLLKKAIDYTRPRVIDPELGLTTDGNLPKNLPGMGVIAGGLQGYLTGGTSGAVAGTVGGYAGLKVAQATGSEVAGLGAAAVTGAATAVATTLGMTALTGGVATLPAAAMAALVGGTAAVSGAAAGLPGGFGVMSGGLQGFFAANGFQGAVAGSIGSYFGTRVGMKTGSTLAAFGAGAAAGAALGAGTTAAMASILSVAVPWPVVAGAALMGGFAGAVGTMAGSLKASTRDSVYGGLGLGAIAASYTGNPAMAIAGAAAAGAAGTAATRTGQAVLGVLTGAAAGALAGAPGGLPAMATSALAGAVIAPLGSVLGSVSMQVRRNFTVDGIAYINGKLNPYLDKHPLSKTGKLMAGAAAGAIVGGSIGLVAGVPGAVVMGTVGAAGGAWKAHEYLKNVEIEKTVQKYGGRPFLYANVIAAQEAVLNEGEKPAA